MKPCAEWTNDCQGKKDYDGEIVTISTRYWPRGGGYNIFDAGLGRFIDPPDSPASATASIMLHRNLEDENDFHYYQDLIKESFEGESFEEVKPQVEEWVERQFQRVVRALEREFATEEITEREVSSE